jgi:hypothetical protein
MGWFFRIGDQLFAMTFEQEVAFGDDNLTNWQEFGGRTRAALEAGLGGSCHENRCII